MKKVAFICVHNSCRSQIAEALGRHLAADVFESYSAGTETKPQINSDAVRLMKQVHHIDMEAEGQHSKLLSDIPEVDVVITMGCNVECPFLPCRWREDWGLEDPTGKPDEAFLETIHSIEKKVLELKERLQKIEIKEDLKHETGKQPGNQLFSAVSDPLGGNLHGTGGSHRQISAGDSCVFESV